MFVIRFRPLPRVSNPVKALRQLLKAALRIHGFRAVSVEINQNKTGDHVMDMGKFASQGFLAGGPEIEKISAIEEGKYNKPVLIFASGRRLSLNGTNTSTLIKEFGTRDSADWIKKDIELYVGPLAYNGTTSPAVLVRRPKTAPKAAPKAAPNPGPLPDEPPADLEPIPF
jgi:hypothetical protein